MKLLKTSQRSTLTEKSLTYCLMIKLEGETIQEFDPKPAINYWLDSCLRRPGAVGLKENIEESGETSSAVKDVPDEVSISVEESEEGNEVAEDVLEVAEPMEYELVENAEDDSDYNSDFNSDDEDSNDIFEKIAKY